SSDLVIFIHAAQSSNVHAMKDRVKEITANNPQVSSYTIYDDPKDGDEYDKSGYIDLEWLRTVIPTSDAAFDFCGPKGFMRASYHLLKQLEVQDTNIHYEIFGSVEYIRK